MIMAMPKITGTTTAMITISMGKVDPDESDIVTFAVLFPLEKSVGGDGGLEGVPEELEGTVGVDGDGEEGVGV